MVVATLCACTFFNTFQQPTWVRTVPDQREVSSVTVATKLPAHDRAAVRIEAHFKACAAIRLAQLVKRGFLGHIRFVKQKSR